MFGSAAHLRAFNSWLGQLPHRHKVAVSGNHDPGFPAAGYPGVGLAGLRDVVTGGARALAVTIHVSRSCNSIFRLLAGQFSLYPFI